MIKNLLPIQETQGRRFDPWVGKIPWRRKWQPTPVFLPGKFHGWKSLMGSSPWDRRELDMTELGSTDHPPNPLTSMWIPNPWIPREVLGVL